MIKLNLYSLLLSLYMVATLAGCYGESSSIDGENSTGGSISFQLEWDNGAVPTESGSYHPQRGAPPPVCTDHNIQRIHAKAVDQSSTEQSGEDWPCEQGHGELTDLPAGVYHVTIQGEVAGRIEWFGEAPDIQVVDNQLTAIGTVQMRAIFDDAAPTVVQTMPGDNYLGVALDSTITATFSEAIMPDSIGPQNFILTYMDEYANDIRVDCTFRYDSATHSAILTPTQGLLSSRIYTGTITVDTGLVVEDMAGNLMEEEVEWDFITRGEA